MIGSITNAVRRFFGNSMATPELAAQVERESAELVDAPIVQSAGLQDRCHFCGQVVAPESYSLVHGPRHPGTGAHVGDPRIRGRCCGG